MVRRIVASAGVALLVTLLLGSVAWAKVGVSSQSVPDEVNAGDVFPVTFQIEDHDGVMQGVDTMKVVAQSLSSKEELAFEALLDGDTFVANLSLPTSGTW